MRRDIAAIPSCLLMTFAGAYGALCCFLSAFSLEVDTGALLVVTAVCALIYAPLLSLRRVHGGFAFALAFISSAAHAYSAWDEIYAAGQSVLYRALYIGADALGRARPLVPEGMPLGWETADVTAVFILAMLVLTACIAWASSARGSFALAFLFPMLFLAGPLFLTITPDFTPLLAVVAYWTAALATHTARSVFHARADWMGLLLAPFLIAMMLGVLHAQPMEEYVRPAALDELRTELTLWSDINLNTRVFQGFGADAPGSTDFSNAGDWRTNGTRMLAITDKKRADNYLRGNTGAVYTGTGWDVIDDEHYEALQSELEGDMALLSGMAPVTGAPGTGEPVTVEYIYADKRMLYTPYYLRGDPNTAEGLSTAYDRAILKDRRISQVAMSVLSPNDADPVGDGSADMARYAEFVREHYMGVPDALRDKLLETLMAYGVRLPDYSTSESIAAWNAEVSRTAFEVREYLSDAAKYSLSPGNLPARADIVEYFLFENKQGYCIHFATAGTLLFRTLGIPARYAEGFVVRKGNFIGDTAEIPDKQAHAWVEVFYEGIGWLPMEVTPGADLSIAGADSIFDREEATPTPVRSTTPRAVSTPPPIIVPGEGGSAPPPVAQNPATWPYVLAGAALLIAFCLAPGVILRRRRRAAFARGDVNARVIARYEYIHRLVRQPRDIPETIRYLAEKAQFSRHTLDETALQTVQAYVEEARVQAYRARPVYEKVWMWLKGL